jgi:two-component system sensor histidine kinase BarA
MKSYFARKKVQMEQDKNNAASTDTIIDWEQCLKLTNNKPDLARDLLLILMKELPLARQNIDLAYSKKNYRELYQYIHKLHGASCYCGVPRLRSIIADIEDHIKANNTDLIDDLLYRLQQEIDKVETHFKSMDFSKLTI